MHTDNAGCQIGWRANKIGKWESFEQKTGEKYSKQTISLLGKMMRSKCANSNEPTCYISDTLSINLIAS